MTYKKISDLDDYGTMDSSQAALEIEQANLAAGTRSRKITMDDFLAELGDDAWTTTTSLSNGWTGTVNYIIEAGHVTLNCWNLDGSSATADTILTLPSGYRPSVAQVLPAYITGAATSVVTVATGGAVASPARTASVRARATYPVL